MRTTLNCMIIVIFALPAAVWAAAPTPTPRPDACAMALEGPDYVPGVDAEGRPVARADIGVPPASLPDAVTVPLPGAGRGRGPAGRGRAAGTGVPPYAVIDGRRLAPLVNPPDPCRR
jgi:hypothetical protein